jgi:4-amino-4-deoxy-L-arabinose transferase-like glycosyltransferase
MLILTSDPPVWLSWSSGIYSDEGIYASDARSLALTGHWAPGDFHSAVICPLHTVLLLGLFHLFGVSLWSARLLGVIASAVTIVLFYFALRRSADERVAALATVFLAFSPVFLFYNRMALLETPTVCLLVLAYFLRGVLDNQFACGLALALAVAYKPLALLAAPAFFADIVSGKQAALWRLAGLLAGLLLYAAAWQGTHAAFLGQVNHYYLVHQYLPHSLSGLLHNMVRGVWSGSSDGFLPYMLHHEPVLLLLTAAGWALHRGALSEQTLLFRLWLAVPALAFLLISYAPSRYFVLVWPALCALAALAAVQAPTSILPLAVVLFAAASLAAYSAPALGPVYGVRSAGLRLASFLRSGDIIAGQYAPELGFYNPSPSLYVQPGLANSAGPLRTDYAIVTDSPFWDAFWRRRLRVSTLEPVLTLDLPGGQRELIIPAGPVVGR